MMLDRLRIAPKINLVVLLFATVIALLTATAVFGLYDASSSVARISGAERSVALACRMNTNIQVNNGLQFQATADPAGATALRQRIGAEDTLFAERAAAAGRLVSGEQADLLATLVGKYATYRNAVEAVLSAAEGGQPLEKRLTAAHDADKLAGEARGAARAFFSRTEKDAAALETQASRDTSLGVWVMIGFAGVGLAFGIGLAALIARTGILRPLSASVDGLKRLADGDLATEIPGLHRADEFGQVAAAMQAFRDSLVHQRALEQAAATDRAAREARAQRLETLATGFDHVAMSLVESVAAAARDLQATASSLAGSADRTTTSITTMATAAERASSNVAAVAAAAEQLSSSISEISRQISQENDDARTAVAEIEQSGEAVERLTTAVGAIGDSAQQIAAIAGQTNMLALNATIESARAGSAGKGFAVVATEVKQLAGQTAQATQEIGRRLTDVETGTDATARAIRDVAGLIERIAGSANGIAAAVEEQSAATADIARNIDQAAQGTAAVSETVAGVRQDAEAAEAGAAEVRHAAAELAAQSDRLREEVHRFLEDVRRA
jgi:methyl-accepting chemotaxis protein